MILDTLDHAPFYRGLHPLLVRGLEFLRSADLEGLPVGKHTLDGEKLFAIVDEYTTRPAETIKLEAHRRYHDIQYMARGSERFGYARLSHVTVVEPYDPSRDVAFFKGDHDLLHLAEGMFAHFAQHDVHGPQLAAGSPQAVRKIVVKVELPG